MKKFKRAFLISLCSSIFLISCSNTPTVKVTQNEEQTIRFTVLNKESTVNWTKSLEENRLSEKIDSIDSISNSVRITTDILKVVKGDNSPIYPYIEEFGGLDISNLDSQYKSHINAVFEALNTDPLGISEKVLNQKYVFNYVFFVNDLKDFWKEHFHVDFPQENAFNKYLLGEPFVSNDIVQVPVRFYTADESIDLCFYFYTKESSRLSQIEITGYSR